MNRAGGALFGTHAAVLALLRVDVSQVVFHCDRVEFANLLALHASDTGVGTLFTRHAALLCVVAFDHDQIFGRADPDQRVRAGLRTGAAGNAGIFVHDSYAVADVDGVEVTGCLAVTQTQTSKGACVHAAEQVLCSLAGLDVIIGQERLDGVSGAVAHHNSQLLFARFSRFSENFAQLRGNSRTANRTFVDGQFRILNKRVGIVIAAGEPAAAAVCAGQLRTQLGYTLIDRHIEYLRCVTQDAGGHKTDRYNHYDCNYYQIHSGLLQSLRYHALEAHEAQGQDRSSN